MELQTHSDLFDLPLEEVVARAEQHLRDLAYSRRTLTVYRSVWQKLLKFAQQEGLENKFSLDMARCFLVNQGIEANELVVPLSDTQRRIRGAVNTLSKFAQNGYIIRNRIAFQLMQLPLIMQETLHEYEKFCTGHLHLADKTMRVRSRNITSFMNFLHSQRLSSMQAICPSILSDFVLRQRHLKTITLVSLAKDLRCFLRYLCMKQILVDDLSLHVPKIRRRPGEQIPSVWKPENLDALLRAVDRNSSKGKRDYAMLLLACRLGLRVGEISSLCLEHLRWDEGRIEMLQSKTKAQLNVPLIEEVGEALIDYLNNGRPQTTYRQVFLKATAPFEPFGPNAHFHGIVSLYCRRAGIALPARSKRGMHSLRHTMATRLQERGTPLETIAGVLGHKSLDSTRIYAKVDIAALRDAALDPEEVNHA